MIFFEAEFFIYSSFLGLLYFITISLFKFPYVNFGFDKYSGYHWPLFLFASIFFPMILVLYTLFAYFIYNGKNIKTYAFDSRKTLSSKKLANKKSIDITEAYLERIKTLESIRKRTTYSSSPYYDIKNSLSNIKDSLERIETSFPRVQAKAESLAQMHLTLFSSMVNDETLCNNLVPKNPEANNEILRVLRSLAILLRDVILEEESKIEQENEKKIKITLDEYDSLRQQIEKNAKILMEK